MNWTPPTEREMTATELYALYLKWKATPPLSLTHFGIALSEQAREGKLLVRTLNGKRLYFSPDSSQS